MKHKNIPNSQVISKFVVSLIEREPQQMFESKIDLSALAYSTTKNGWVIPLKDKM